MAAPCYFIFLSMLVVSLAIRCHICDTFSGYCDFDGSLCVAPKCARRSAPTPSGLIREQRLCVPSDSPVGCRKAILWDDIEGTECVCDSHMCNSSDANNSPLYLTFTTLFFWKFFI